MGDPRPDKVAVVEEVREKLDAADAVLLTEYRGLDVPGMAELRRSLREAGGEYKIYKNTLVRLAAEDAGIDIEALLTGPTAIAFVGDKADGSPGDAAAVAKTLKDFAKSNEALVLKGGVLNDAVLSVEEIKALAELPSREVLLAQLAGALQAPMTNLARLLNAVPQSFAYGLQALIDAGGGADAADGAAPAEPETDASEEPAEATAEATEEPAEAPAEATEEPAEATAEATEEPAEAPADADEEEEA